MPFYAEYNQYLNFNFPIMDRRAAIRNLALVIGSAAVLPACTPHHPVAHYQNFDVNYDQQSLLGDMSETIIPKTTTPGAKDLSLHLFVLKMVDDCSKKKDQQDFMTGMDQFTALTKKMYGSSFSDLSRKNREALLNSFEDKKNDHPKEANIFYGTVKGLTVFGYTTSKYFMTQQVIYELVPGRYNAFYPVSKLKQA